METGNEDEQLRNSLLTKLAAISSFRLPTQYISGTRLLQYQPHKKKGRTLFPDAFTVIEPSDSIAWVWESVELTPDERELLSALLARMHYFGRSESWTQCRLLPETSDLPIINCVLESHCTNNASSVASMEPQFGGCGSSGNRHASGVGIFASMVPQVGGCGSRLAFHIQSSPLCFNGAAGWGLREFIVFSAVILSVSFNGAAGWGLRE